MEFLKERERFYEKELKNLNKKMKEVKDELTRIRKQINEQDEQEIQREFKNEVGSLQSTLNKRGHWKSPEGKRKKINEDDCNEEREEQIKKRQRKDDQELFDENSGDNDDNND